MKNASKVLKSIGERLRGKKEKPKPTFSDIVAGFSDKIDELSVLADDSTKDLKTISGQQAMLEERKKFAESELNNATSTITNIKNLISPPPN